MNRVSDHPLKSIYSWYYQGSPDKGARVDTDANAIALANWLRLSRGARVFEIDVVAMIGIRRRNAVPSVWGQYRVVDEKTYLFVTADYLLY